MKHVPILLFTAFCLIPLLPAAQSLTTGEWLPQLSYSNSLNNRFSGNLNTFMEIQNLEKTPGSQATYGFSPQTFNIQAGLAYQWTTALNLSLAYQFGWRSLDEAERDVEHRLMQQITGTYSFGKYRLRSRLRAEQRFFRQNGYAPPVHRWRLRPSIDFPLQGERLDLGEAYLNTQWEVLANIFEPRGLHLAEQRLYSGIGWLLSRHFRLETGLEYRSRPTDASGFRRRAFLRMAATLR
ncbi:MAG: DUF2490 domain-containing protein [Phaeodactylibacter sp.]|nr:DUF2490 domain-containing protein [Phaeodactylibacter sp.]MCB9277002.1 DUF2490 domain-containing protein [Lewinellaceae bacterium]